MVTIRAKDTGEMIKIPSRRDEGGTIYFACPWCGTEGSELEILGHILEKGHNLDPFPRGY